MITVHTYSTQYLDLKHRVIIQDRSSPVAKATSFRLVLTGSLLSRRSLYHRFSSLHLRRRGSLCHIFPTALIGRVVSGDTTTS